MEHSPSDNTAHSSSPLRLLFRAFFWGWLRHEWKALALGVLSVSMGLALSLAIRVATQSPALSFEQRLESLQTSGLLGPIEMSQAAFARSGLANLLQDADLLAVTEASLFLEELGPQRVFLILPEQSFITQRKTFPQGRVPSQQSTDSNSNSLPQASLFLDATCEYLAEETEGKLNLGDASFPISFSQRKPEQLGMQLEFNGCHDDSLFALLSLEQANIPPELRRILRANQRYYLSLHPNESRTSAELVQSLSGQLVALSNQISGFSYTADHTRLSSLKALTRSFDTNLQIMSAVSLLSAVLIVAYVAHLILTRHAASLALVRALGIPFNKLALPLIALLLVMGALSAVLGLILGLTLGTFIAGETAEVVRSLYLSELNPEFFSIHLSDIAIFLTAAVGATLLGALPSWRALRSLDSASTLKTGSWQSHSSTPKNKEGGSWDLSNLRWWGVVSLAMLVIVVAPHAPMVWNRTPLTGLAACFACLLLTVLVSGRFWVWLLQIFGKLASLPLARGTSIVHGTLLMRAFLHPSTSLLVQIMCISISLTIGVRTMVDSFRTSLDTWTEQTMRSPIWIRHTAGNLGGIPAHIIEAVRKSLPRPQEGGVSFAVERLAATQAMVFPAASGDEKALPMVFNGTDLSTQQLAGTLQWVWPAEPSAQDDALSRIHTSPTSCQGTVRSPCPVLISESAAIHLSTSFDFDARNQELLSTRIFGKTVVVQPWGIFRDFGNDQGTLSTSFASFAGFAQTQGRTIEPFFLRVSPQSNVPTALSKTETDTLLRNIEQAARNIDPELTDQLEFLTLADIKRRVDAAFQQTFQMTDALYALSLLISLVTVLCVMSLQATLRARDWATLWATSLTRKQISRSIAASTGALALIAGVTSLPFGLLLAWLLVKEINLYAFGFSLSFTMSIGFLVFLVCSSGVAGALGGTWIGRLVEKRLNPQTLNLE